MKAMLLGLALAVLAVGCEGKRRPSVREESLQSNRPSKSSAQEFRQRLLGDTCDECKAAVKLIDGYARNPIYIEVGKKGLEALCKELFSGDDLQACLQFAERLPSVVEQLKPLLDHPEKLCKMVYLCGAERSRAARVLLLAFKRQFLRVPLSHRERNALCDECQFGIQELKTLWDNKNIEEEVEAELKSVCSLVGQYKDTCNAIVDQYWPTIVQYVDDELSHPKEVCSSIGLCATKFLEVEGQDLFPARPSSLRLHLPRSSAFFRLAKRLSQTQRAAGGRVGCTLCTLAFTTVQSTLLDEAFLRGVAAQIETKLEALLPGAYRAPVQDFLATYLVPVLNLAVRQLTPREVCDALKACDSSESLLSSETLERVSVRANGAVVCDSCKLLAEAAVGELSQPDVQKEITDELLQICDFIPGQYVDECDSLLRENMPTVFEDLIAQLEPNTVCPELGLCPRRRLVGRRPNADGVQDQIRA